MNKTAQRFSVGDMFIDGDNIYEIVKYTEGEEYAYETITNPKIIAGHTHHSGVVHYKESELETMDVFAQSDCPKESAFIKLYFVNLLNVDGFNVHAPKAKTFAEARVTNPRLAKIAEALSTDDLSYLVERIENIL